jgi:hypothetical protein
VVLAFREAAETLQDLLWAKDDRQLLGHLGSPDYFVEVPISVESNFVQKMQRGYGDSDGGGS